MINTMVLHSSSVGMCHAITEQHEKHARQHLSGGGLLLGLGLGGSGSGLGSRSRNRNGRRSRNGNGSRSRNGNSSSCEDALVTAIIGVWFDLCHLPVEASAGAATGTASVLGASGVAVVSAGLAASADFPSAGPGSAGFVSVAAVSPSGGLPSALAFLASLSFCGKATSVRKMPQMLRAQEIRGDAYLLEDSLELALQVVESVESC